MNTIGYPFLKQSEVRCLNRNRIQSEKKHFQTRGVYFLVKKALTARQELVLDFIKAFIRIKGVSPCLQEIAQGLSLRSRSNIHRIVHALKDKKRLNINPLKARSIRLKRKRKR